MNSTKTIEQAAAELKRSQAKISRLETGRGVPKQRDVRDLLRLCGVGQDEMVDEDLKGFDDDGVLEHGDRYIALEQGMSQFRLRRPPHSRPLADGALLGHRDPWPDLR